MQRPVTTAMMSAMLLTLAISVSAQTSPIPPERGQRDASPQDRTNQSNQAVTVTGCLREEKDVPGQHPNIAERVGINEDYILTDVKMAQGSSTSAMGIAPMYKIKGVSESELKNHAGHQVEVSGQLSLATSREASGSVAGPTFGRTGSSTTSESGGSTTGGSTTSSPVTSGSSGSTAPSGSATSSASGAAGSSERGGTGTSLSPNTDLPQIEATSVRMIAATCTPQ
jgi:hypothetical protein